MPSAVEDVGEMGEFILWGSVVIGTALRKENGLYLVMLKMLQSNISTSKCTPYRNSCTNILLQRYNNTKLEMTYVYMIRRVA